MKSIAFKLIVIAALAAPTTSLAQETEGQRLANLAFTSLDIAGRGFVDAGEFSNFGGDVFFSMDYDENNKLSLGEFLGWDYGMLPLAQDADREDAYYTALRVVFAFWDRNGDGVVSKTEHRQSLNADFLRADTNNNAILSQGEFTSGFSVMVALRAAINPVPVAE